MHTIDLRSDTLSQQPTEVVEAALRIRVGDDVFGEDNATVALENTSAELFGMEKGLFVASGTMANLIALMGHTKRGQEIILGKLSHIFNYERAGASALAGLAFHTVDDGSGLPDPPAIEAAIRGDEIYHPETGLICIENTHNMGGGVANTVESVTRIAELAKRRQLPLHLDGARIFNACALFGVDPADFGRLTDTCMFCLTKGIGAPVGAILMGSKAFIDEARKTRKMLGGGMRQTGYLAEMALRQLQNWHKNAVQDNEHARIFLQKMAELEAFQPLLKPNMTNMIYFSIKGLQKPAHEYLPELEKHGIKLLANQIGYRVVFHNGIHTEDLDTIVRAFKSALA